MPVTPSCLSIPRPLGRRVAGALLLAALSLPAQAATDLVVRVGGVRAPAGQVGCSLFAEATGFPMDNRLSQQQWVPAQAGVVTCRYSGLPPGRYAVSVGHDLNGNRRVDTNLLGMPTEPWGVSNQVRPSLRAPRFDEAVFTIPADAAEHVVRIEVAR